MTSKWWRNSYGGLTNGRGYEIYPEGQDATPLVLYKGDTVIGQFATYPEAKAAAEADEAGE